MDETLHTVMEGNAFYNRNSEPQRLVNQLAIPHFVEAARQVALPVGRPLFIVDYGSSQGANSLAPLSAAIDALRARTPMAIAVLHVDQPSNDFTALFQAIRNTDQNYARRPDVYYAAIGRSFYEDVMPPGTVDLGWSANAIQWLQTKPCPVIGHIWPYRGDVETRTRYDVAADADWRQFLDRRAQEMAPGAWLVVSVRTLDEAEPPALSIAYDVLNDIARDMVAEGHLRPAEYERFLLPTVFRTADEIRAPFGEVGYLSRHGARLRLLAVDEIDVPQPLLEKFRRDGDAAAYGRAESDFIRAFTAPVLRHQLDATRTLQDRDAVIDALFARAAESYAKNPEAVEPRRRQLVLSIVRDPN